MLRLPKVDAPLRSQMCKMLRDGEKLGIRIVVVIDCRSFYAVPATPSYHALARESSISHSVLDAVAASNPSPSLASKSSTIISFSRWR